MRCPSCGFENPEALKFCGDCGRKLAEQAAPKLRCGSCGFENQPGVKFCSECGGRFDERPAAPPHPRSYTPPHLAARILAEHAAMEARGAAEGERKTITALFADIKGSVEMMQDLDPEEARKIVDPALELMMDAVHRYEGYVAQSRGDGILALFGAPIAVEDHARRALHAALRMQEEIRRYSDRLRIEKGVLLEIRVGVNTGEVVVRSIRKDDLHTDYVPIGHSTNLAARLESLATPGSILVSEQTRKLTEGYFEFQSLGAARVKDVSEAVELHQVMGPGPLRTKLEVSAKRGLVRFVGRETEMADMSSIHTVSATP
jgi:class 3 adenylate cyclase